MSNFKTVDGQQFEVNGGNATLELAIADLQFPRRRDELLEAPLQL